MRSKLLVTQSCLTLCEPMDCSPPSSSVHGISWARMLKGLLFPSPGDLPVPGIEPGFPALHAVSLLPERPGNPIRFSQNVKMRCKPSASSVLPGKIALPARSWFCGVLNVEENLSPTLRLVMSELQARPGCKRVSCLQFFLPSPASLLVNSTGTFRKGVCVCVCVFIFWKTEIWFVFSRAFF